MLYAPAAAVAILMPPCFRREYNSGGSRWLHHQLPRV
jgi:hypothetical protein